MSYISDRMKRLIRAGKRLAEKRRARKQQAQKRRKTAEYGDERDGCQPYS